MTAKNITQLKINLPTGNYRTEWVNVTTGKKVKTGKVKSSGSPVTLKVPAYDQDIALRIKKR